MINETTQLDKEIKELVKTKRELYKNFDTKKITTEQYNTEMFTANEKLRKINKKKMFLFSQTFFKTTDTIKKEEAAVKTAIKEIHPNNYYRCGAEVDKNSLSSYIIEVLQNKEVNNIDKVVALVHHKKPSMSFKKIRTYVQATISKINKGEEKRYKNYVWDKHTYTLKKK